MTLAFAESGLRAEFDLPLDRLRAGARGSARGRGLAAAPERGDSGCLRRKRILVVEDDYIVGEETAGALRAAGCEVSGPVGTLDDALHSAVTEDLDAATLDINIEGAFVWPAARALRERRIPFVFVTGYADTMGPPPELSDAPRIEKPVAPETLVSALAGALKSDPD